ncbi:3'-5' exonuclease [Candidatus Marinarcus aquaticus]|uniref:DNA polymerase III subunit epsilon n=1 Tax=Candidatus Marinarcus aquaticus TaxID=2044504 RepID=A0A4Q0XRC5_9BACT|nr:3'-5' exonuclease [Candidatus Marinarcus aquaticus]RXJ59940.1 DNA polymerase III subunit epsilon [Candidatus Marinarcus aquaticus]
MIILDFETNTQNERDVIEVAAVKVSYEKSEWKVLDKFHRYYFSRYPVNPYSYEVHKLSPELISDIRDGVEYARYFNEDEEFIEFCAGASTLVAHNISFELRHLRNIIYFENHICTMKENKPKVKALNRQGRIKNPTLDEVCLYYGIEFDKSKHHSATYDVTKTFQILKKMQGVV